MVLQSGQRDERHAVRDREDGELFTLHEFFDEHLRARGAKAIALQHVVDRAVGLIDRGAHDHTLSRRESGRLDHDGRTEAPSGGLRRGTCRVHLRACRRDAVLEHQLLGKRLRRLDLGGRLRRAEDREAGRLEAIDDACGEWRLGADDREVNRAIPRERFQRGDVRGANGNALRNRGDSRITRSGLGDPHEKI